VYYHNLDCCACRVRKKRMFIDPKTLVPKLPKPRDLQPFPNALSMCYSGHTGRVRSISPHPGSLKYRHGTTLIFKVADA